MSATELIRQVTALPPQEKARFLELIHALENGASPAAPANGQHWPDFAQRLRAIYGGKVTPDSQSIIDEGRGIADGLLLRLRHHCKTVRPGSEQGRRHPPGLRSRRALCVHLVAGAGSQERNPPESLPPRDHRRRNDPIPRRARPGHRGGTLGAARLRHCSREQKAEELSAGHAAALGCRTLDIIHAAALVLAAKEFVTFDQRQTVLAKTAGLHVKS